MTSNESETLIQGLLQKLLAQYQPQKVILYGSYAYGNPRPNSDIDLLIIKETSERFIDRWTTVRRILTDPKRKAPIEPLVLTPHEMERRLRIGDQFVAEILRRGRLLYEV
ncbi:MAG: nucleotidyltransferase domain-containing protein [candidate division KSB1 bacterium]